MVEALPGVRLGGRVQVTFSSDEDYDEHWSRIEDIAGETLMLSVPLRRGVPVWPLTGESIDIRVHPSDATTPELFLSGQVLGRQTQPIEVVIVHVTGAGQQRRREYFRLPVKMLPVDCSVWVREFGRPESEAHWQGLSAIIVNISGGGIAIEIDREVMENARVHVRFPWPTAEGTFSSDLTVKNVRPAFSGRGRYLIGCEFRRLNRLEQERILQSIHRYQVEQIKIEQERQRERERVATEAG